MLISLVLISQDDSHCYCGLKVTHTWLAMNAHLNQYTMFFTLSLGYSFLLLYILMANSALPYLFTVTDYEFCYWIQTHL